MRSVRGFTIVETLVAVMVLTVGLLALVSTAAVATRLISDGQRQTVVSTRAHERIEILRAQGCPIAGSGSEARGAFAVAWQVEATPGGRARSLVVVVTSQTPRGPRADTVATVHMCP